MKKKNQNTIKNPKNQVGKMSEIFQREKDKILTFVPGGLLHFWLKNSILTQILVILT